MFSPSSASDGEGRPVLVVGCAIAQRFDSIAERGGARGGGILGGEGDDLASRLVRRTGAGIEQGREEMTSGRARGRDLGGRGLRQHREFGLRLRRRRIDESGPV